MLLELKHLTVEFPSPRGPVAAVRDLSFSLEAGETLALVGESGSGKSVTSLAIMGLLAPGAHLTGEVRFEDRDLAQASAHELQDLRGRRLAMIFQEPMTALNPIMRVGDQIAEALCAHDRTISRGVARQRAVAALDEVLIPEPASRVDSYPHQLSGGQRQRVMIAMALINRPSLLIADEPTTALDVTVQAQILALLAELRARRGLAMLFVSHDLAVVAKVASRVAVLYAGLLVEAAPVAEIFAHPAHPYTRGLLASIPTLETDRTKPLAAIEGSVPSPAALPPGCPFAPRCPLAIDACRAALPPLTALSPTHIVRCLRAADLAQ